MDIKEIVASYAAELAAVKEIMTQSLRSDVRLLDSVNKSLSGVSGKMLRPLVTLLCAKACSGDAPAGGDTLLFASASELLHNATLMHDDVIDDAPLRRGRPTVSSLLSPKGAVLIGDWWLVKAVSNILAAEKESEKAIRIFSKTISDLAEAELRQMEKASDASATEDDYFRIIYGKTASLFEAAAVSGALSAGATGAETEAIREYAVNAGLAFQIKDDMLDYGDSSLLGKPCGTDLREQKVTLPLLGALSRVAPSEALEVRRRVSALGDNPSDVGGVRDFVLENGGLEYSEQVLGQYIGKAVAALSKLPPTKAREDLAQIAAFIGDRES